MADTRNDEASDPTERALRAMLDAEQRRRRVDERRQRSWLRRQAEESVSMVDVLGALAGHGAAVTLHTEVGPLPTGPITEVGSDYVAMPTDHPGPRLVPIRAITSVRTAADAPAPPRWPSPSPAHDLVERLAELAPERPLVAVTTTAEVVTGRLRRVGREVLSIEDAAGRDAFVALRAVVEVVLCS